ncbi:MAG: hypothetical protein ACJ79U_15830 [Myxococcales bacterium]
MRPTSPCILVAVLLAACGPVDTGSGSSAPSIDGGPVWSGGGAPDAPDAPDAGTPAPPDPGNPPAQSACDGIVPSSNPDAISATVPHHGGDACWYLTTDEQGDIAAEAHSANGPPRWELWSPSGSVLGSRTARFDFFGQRSGFEGTYVESGSTFFARYANDGTELTRTLLGGPGCTGEAFLSAAGGAFVLGGCEKGPLTATFFDDSGRPAASKEIAPKRMSASGVVDVKGAALVIVWPGNAVGASGSAAGRWFDASLSPVTDWFSLPGNGEPPLLRPLTGGGAALQVGGTWVATIASGKSGWTAAPPWLASRSGTDLAIVRQGRAYALIAKPGSSSPRNRLELFTPEGEHCGAGTFPGDGLSLGPDGTVIGSSGEGGCEIRWWPAVLR